MASDTSNRTNESGRISLMAPVRGPGCTTTLTATPVNVAAVLHVHEQDNVVVALRPLQVGERIAVGARELTIAEPITPGHKVAIADIAAGAPVLKYGFTIGTASAPIGTGQHVHSHNVRTLLTEEVRYHYQGCQRSPSSVPPNLPSEFLGYRRADGRVGTRNELWIINTVGCVSKSAQRIADQANRLYAGQIAGAYAFTHPFGCSQLGDDLAHTRALLAGLIQHPNAGGVLVIGLGCESNQLKTLLAQCPDRDPSRIRAYSAQQVEDEFEQGMAAVAELVAEMQNDSRVPCPVSELVLGMKCGGSDGFSGLTANPLVGRVADWLCASSGKVLLTETPEMFGAEKVLMARADSQATFEGIVSLVNQFKQHFIDNGQPVYENPSPGNKDGGITTLEEKSLGAIQKGGQAVVTDVIPYGDRVQRSGLTLLEGPGNDAVSSTALAASGATLILFTTGRGTPLGFPVPTIKISSNSALAARKPQWIDFDAGSLLEQGSDRDAVAQTFCRYLIDVASGKATCNERADQREIAIWKTGVTL
jgi:altronate hydrolase